jgi:hypothetical protein
MAIMLPMVPAAAGVPRTATFTYRDVIIKSDDGRWLFKERRAE